MAGWWSNDGERRYEETYGDADLTDAVTSLRQELAGQFRPRDGMELVGLARLLLHRHAVYRDEDDLYEAMALAAEAAGQRLDGGDGFSQVAGAVRETLSRELLLAALRMRPDTAEAGSRAARTLLEASGADAEAAVLMLEGVASLYLEEGRLTDLRAALDLYEVLDGLPAAFAESLTKCVLTRMSQAGPFVVDPQFSREELRSLIGLFGDAVESWQGPPEHLEFVAIWLTQVTQAWATASPHPVTAELNEVIEHLAPLVGRLNGHGAMLITYMVAARCLERFEQEPSEEHRVPMVRHAHNLVENWPELDLNMRFVPATALLVSHRYSDVSEELDTATELLESMVRASGEARPYVKVSLADALTRRMRHTPDPSTVRRCAALLASVDPAQTSSERLVAAISALAMAAIDQPGAAADAATLRLGAGLCQQAWRIASDRDLFSIVKAVHSLADAVGLRPDARLGELARRLESALAAGDVDGCRVLEEEASREFADLPAWIAVSVRKELFGRAAGGWVVVAALRAAHATHPADPWIRCELGTALLARYARWSLPDDPAEAFAILEAALPEITGTGARIVVLDSLAGASSLLFQQSGDESRLGFAITSLRQAVSLSDEDSPLLPTLLANLSDKLNTRYALRGRKEDLLEILALSQRAAALLVEESPADTRFRVYNAMAGALRFLHPLEESTELLDRAIEAMRIAVAALPDDDPAMPSALHNLAGCLQDRNASVPGAVSKSEIVALHRRAVELTSPGRPELPGRLISLAGALAGRSRTDEAEPEDRADAERILRERLRGRLPQEMLRFQAAFSLACIVPSAEAIALCQEIVAAEGAGIDLRMRAALLWTEQAAEVGDDSLSAWNELVALLEAVASGDLPRGDRERFLSWYQGEVADAAALALTAARPADALDLLERARSLLWAHEPGDWRELSASLGTDLAVVVSAGRGRGDMIVVGQNGPQVVRLPGFDAAAATDMAGTLLGALRVFQGGGAGEYLSAQAAAGRVLARMWKLAAEPLLREVPDLAGRRVVWCPVGVAALLPWHAAGPVGEPGMLSLVTSSYTTSLRALTAVRRGKNRRRGRIDRLLTVAVGDRRGSPMLDHVPTEIAMIRQFLPDTEHTVLLNLQATREEVLREFAQHRFVHFACHAVQDSREPSRGGVVLADGILEALDLSRAGGGELAFLSACGTAWGGTRLLDEAIHPAAALFRGGFAQVVGTLWPVVDAQAAEVAAGFYSRAVDSDDAAGALREALVEVQDRYPLEPLLWAGYVHWGG